MNNIEMLTERLNACKHPRKIYNALSVFASSANVQNAKDLRDAMTRLDKDEKATQRLTQTSSNGEPWFVAADVCKALELDDVSKAILRLDDEGT